ncbi:oncoprotein-induced transcript 3 protein [Austrofundulus limnaeus]|uniref:Oncoprotein-induced transcript 3 protein n=1 Tax=Austrofundulus limnaeus TaxID=52670 RepID=A0A2I4CYW7_AUSLI|nr:PREDICTED: oncoprotein-induced transcript 3 protein-like [Austrofundulus limnaeus]
MTQEFRTDSSGKAEVTLSWTPQQSDLHRPVPVCFTAETSQTQSELRCVVVKVTQSSFTQGKAHVQCSPNKMTVILEKSSMPDIDENFLKLKDPTCSLTSNGTHIMGTISFSTCGTELQDRGDYIAFRNEIYSFERPDEIIVRRRKVQIDFSCEFPKTISISSYYNLHQSDYIFTESSFGSFGYSFEIFNDSSFVKKVEADAYPVQVNLLEMIYMGIEANSDLPNVTLFVESCKGTPDDNPENPLSYEFIQNGCVKDETMKTHSSDQTSFKFEIQAFKFNGDYDQVYITCSVILCEPGSPFSRCAQGCLNTPSRRRRRGLSKETTGHYITQGPLQFVGLADPSAAKTKENNVVIKTKSDAETRSGGTWGFKVFTSNITTVVFGVGFIASLVLLAVIVRHFTRRRREEDRNVLIDSDSEN